MRFLQTPRNVLKDLYDSEINFAIETLWNSMVVRLGDPLNGFDAETDVREWEQAEAWLKEQALIHYPDSRFALMYRDGMSAAAADKKLGRVADVEKRELPSGASS